MNNEYIFLLHISIVSLGALTALRLGSCALTAYVSLVCILSNVFVLKQITLFGLNTTASDSYSISATIGLNLLQEYYSRAQARNTIRITFVLLLFYTIVSYIQLWYLPAFTDTMDPVYQALFAPMPRITIASLTAYGIAQTTDYLLYGFLKRYWHSHFLIGRNYLSISVSQLIDTIVFSFLGLYGIVSQLGEIILVSYSVKLLAILVAVPFVRFSKPLVPASDRL